MLKLTVTSYIKSREKEIGDVIVIVGMSDST